MGWGDPIKDAWNDATTAAKDAANAVGRGAETAADWTAEKAVQSWDWTSEKAVQGWDWTKQFAVDRSREALNYLADGVARAGGALNTGWNDLKKAIDRTSERLIGAYNAIADIFGWDPIDGISESSSCACESKTDGAFVKDGCVATASADEAKAEPVRPDAGNTCCHGKAGGRTIYYVNGISTDLKTHCETLKSIANSTCADVVGIFNATDGFAADTLQTFGDRRLIEQAADGKDLALDGRNPAVDTVSDMVYGEVLAGRQPPEIWAHSQGGAVTSLGLYSANNRLEAAGVFGGLDGMKVKSFGAAAPKWVQGPDYEHYVHINDGTPLFYGLGDNPANDAGTAGGGTVIRFGGKKGQFFRDGPGFKRTLPAPVANHQIDGVYVPMQEQVNGGCGEHATAP